jgi:hypothetical protein
MLSLISSRNLAWSNIHCNGDNIATADSAHYDSDRETANWSRIVLECKSCSNRMVLEFSCACGAKSSHALSVLSEEQQHKKTYTVSPICNKSPDSSMCVSLNDKEVASSGVYLA